MRDFIAGPFHSWLKQLQQVSRVLRAMTDAPPTVALDAFVAQIGAEIAAEEKLEAAKLQDTFKSSNERGRRLAS